MEAYTYLLLNIFTLAIPLARSFETRVAYYKKLKNLLPAILITGSLFLIWDHYFTKAEIWSFNPDYLIGLYIFRLPLEEWLFFLTVPYACVFIYEVLKYFFKREILGKWDKFLAVGMGVVLLILGILNSDKQYTTITFITSGVLLLLLYIIKVKFLGRFFVAYAIILFPFFLFNGILTALPVVEYNNAENLGIRIFTIPLEDVFYGMLLILLNISIYEYLNSRHSTKTSDHK